MDLSWLHSLTPQQATFLSTAIGIPLGFISLATGALINANLNRRRDDTLRQQQALAVAKALHVELKLQRDALDRNYKSLLNPADAAGASHAYIPEPITAVWDALIPNLLMLDEEAIEKALYAYGTLPIYLDGLALQLGEVRTLTSKRSHIAIPVENSLVAAEMTKQVVMLFDDAITVLSATVKRLT